METTQSNIESFLAQTVIDPHTDPIIKRRLFAHLTKQYLNFGEDSREQRRENLRGYISDFKVLLKRCEEERPKNMPYSDDIFGQIPNLKSILGSNLY